MIDLHIDSRVEALATRLADVLAVPPADPLAADWVAVPSEGMRRWLALSLSTRLGAAGQAGDGVAANITFAFPGSLRLAVVEAERSRDEPDPWRVERLVWAVLEVLESDRADRHLAALVGPGRGGSRYGRARRVADLFDRYHLGRPEMVRAWAAGRNVDPSGRPLIEHHAWQPHLWRLVRDRIGEASPPERLPALLDRLRDGSLAVDLPERLAVFGLSLLPGGAGFLELADALAVRRAVHLFLLAPSPALAASIRRMARPVRAAEEPGAGARRVAPLGDPEGRQVGRADSGPAHPLLRSWGRLAAETATLLGALPVSESTDHQPRPARWAGMTDVPADGSGVVPSVLHQLQEDLRLDRAPAGDLRPRPDDLSVQFHACHGATRQVEVLRDAILHCLSDDPSLREDDIVVLCPSLARFAPVIEAVLGPSAESGRPLPPASEGDPGSKHAPLLRYRIADRSLQTSNPVVAATTALLDLVSGRYTIGGVLDFLALEPVRARHNLAEEDLAQIAEWAAETHVCWGFDADHRAAQGIPASIRTNTWLAAIDRLLLGSAVHSDDLDPAVGDVVPFGVEGDDAVLAGRLAEVLWRLGDLTHGAQTPRTVVAWAAWLGEAIDGLLAAPPGSDWQLDAVHRQLHALIDSAARAGIESEVALEFADFCRALTERLRTASGRPDYFRGGVTISSMDPLRSVPHKVICLLGVDQASFAPAGADGDDLAVGNPRMGDRDPRGESRQALLEAVLAAGDRLVVIRDGHDVRTNHAIPPAVVVAELRDAVLASIHGDSRPSYTRQLELDHPRQPYDERCFAPGALRPEGPWGFEPMAFEGARARRARQGQAYRGFLQTPLALRQDRTIELVALHRFLRHPVRTFVEQHLGVRLPSKDEAPSPLLPVELGGLRRWEVGSRLLDAVLRGVTAEEWARREEHLGTLPPGILGTQAVEQVTAVVEALVDRARALGVAPGAASTYPVDVELANGTRIVGSVALRLGTPQPGPARAQFSLDKPEHRVAAWLDLMVLVASEPTVDWRSVTVGRAPRNQVAWNVLVPAAPTDDPAGRRSAAIGALEVAVDCWRRGSAEPLPLFPGLSHKLYLGKARSRDWTDDYLGFGEREEASTNLVFGGYELEQLLALPARTDDPPGTGHRVERYSRYLWGAIEATVLADAASADAGSPALAAPGQDRPRA